MGLLKKLTDDTQTVCLKKSLTDNIVALNEYFSKCFDFVLKRTYINGTECAFVCLDGMCNNQEIVLSITQPILSHPDLPKDAQALFSEIRDEVITSVQQGDVFTLNDAIEAIIGGNLLLLIDGCEKALKFSVQGFPKKGIEPPQSDMQETGSHEGFVDSFKDNVTLIRRRLASPELCLENIKIGVSSGTNTVICYMKNRVSQKALDKITTDLRAIKTDNISGSGCIEPFLQPKGVYLFSGVGKTERPDVFCAKLTEGKIGIIVDGTPHALFVPHLFIENFHTLDDYLKRPYYALFLRILKIFSFIIGVFLPGSYVAITMYHPEMVPTEILYNIVKAHQETPFPIMIETLVIHIIYEIVREAGIRLPKTVGHTISIVGALIIGDAAVTAGLISAPMLIIVALTAITSSTVSDLADPICVLRLVFILIGGTMGIYGVFLGAGIIILNISAQDSLGVPFTLPFAPVKFKLFRDAIIRSDWRKMSKKIYDPQEFSSENIKMSDGGGT